MAIEHPITPPPELVAQWRSDWEALPPPKPCQLEYVAARSADWELEACVEWLITGPYGASIACNADHMIGDLRAARRPKPPSLKEQALALIDIIQGNQTPWDIRDLDVVRKILEALPDD